MGRTDRAHRAGRCSDTTVDAIVAGHTHRVTNTMVGDILVTEGLNAGASYSVLQLAVNDNGEVVWQGGSTRVAKTLGVAPRPDVQAIVDDANARTAVLRNQVVGTQADDVRRDPTRLSESEMGNLVADAMRAKYPGVDGALTNSGGLRADLVVSPPSAGEQPGEITWGEMFAVLPFGNRTVLVTLTGEQLRAALLNGVLAGVRPSDRHRPLPAGGRVADHLLVHRAGAGHRWPMESPGLRAGSGHRDDRHRAPRDQRLPAHRRRRLHGAGRRRPAWPSPATPSSTSPSPT